MYRMNAIEFWNGRRHELVRGPRMDAWPGA